MIRATLKDVINTLSGLTTEHYQLQSFGWGSLDEIEDKEVKGYMLYINPTTNSYDFTNNYSTSKLGLTLFVYTVLNENFDNRIDIISEANEILNDILKKTNKPSFKNANGFTLSPVSSSEIMMYESTQVLFGWYINAEAEIYIGGQCLTNFE